MIIVISLSSGLRTVSLDWSVMLRCFGSEISTETFLCKFTFFLAPSDSSANALCTFNEKPSPGLRLNLDEGLSFFISNRLYFKHSTQFSSGGLGLAGFLLAGGPVSKAPPFPRLSSIL